VSTDREVTADRPVGCCQWSNGSCGSGALGRSAKVCHIETSGTNSTSHHLLSTDTTNTCSFFSALHSCQSVIIWRAPQSQETVFIRHVYYDVSVETHIKLAQQ